MSSENDGDGAPPQNGSAPASWRQSFTPLLSRRMPHPILSASLCPSMDLTALRIGAREVTPERGSAATSSNKRRMLQGEANTHLPIAISSSVSIHRMSIHRTETVTWQRIVSIGSSELTSAEEATEEGNKSIPPKRHDQGSTALCWSPDGRSLAIALADGGIMVHDVEALCATSGSGAEGSTDDSPPGKAHTFHCIPPPSNLRMGNTGSIEVSGAEDSLPKDLNISGPVIAMKWAISSAPHRDWILSKDEQEHEISWSLRSSYLDRSPHFLPPSSYSSRNPKNSADADDCLVAPGGSLWAEGTEDFSVPNPLLRPSAQTPLSLLCAVTSSGGLHIYLHGRLHILTLTATSGLGPWTPESTSVVCASDLSSVAVLGSNPSSKLPILTPEKSTGRLEMMLYSFPELTRNRHDLQVATAMYSAVSAHLSTLQAGLTDAARLWSSALRPLDNKFEALVRSLQNYGILHDKSDGGIAGKGPTPGDAVRIALLRQILTGHIVDSSPSAPMAAASASDMASAVENFFSSAMMNDQLLQRLERSVEANVSGVESAFRQWVRSPALSLLYDAVDLTGLAASMEAEEAAFGSGCDLDSIDDFEDSHFGSSQSPLFCAAMARQFHQQCEKLYTMIEATLDLIVELRFRLRNLLRWIRATASHVKARGAPATGAAKMNAKRRRVPDAVTKDVVSFLASTSNPRTSGSSITEAILGIPLSDTVRTAADSNEGTTSNQSIGEELNACSCLSDKLFDLPRLSLEETVLSFRIRFDQEKSNVVSSSCSRLGSDNWGVMLEASSSDGCFFPHVALKSDAIENGSCVRQWIVVAISGDRHPGGSEEEDALTIVALPIGVSHRGGSSDCALPSRIDRRRPHFYLTSKVALPNVASVVNVQFYGDNGNSTLASSTAHVGPIEEGSRQGLGLFVACKNVTDDEVMGEGDQGRTQDEFWMFEYDDLPFDAHDAQWKDEELTISLSETSASSLVRLVFEDNRDASEDDGSVRQVVGKRRQLRSRVVGSGGSGLTSRLELSGSRGIGGVITDNPPTIDLFDLEEDEDDEDDDEDENMDESS